MELRPLTICTKDVQRIIGKSERTARNLLMAIRKKYGKERHQLVTVPEFSDYTGLPEAQVRRWLDGPVH